jgi:hypothetical protein
MAAAITRRNYTVEILSGVCNIVFSAAFELVNLQAGALVPGF